VPLEAVLITGELNRRPARAPEFEAESRALVALLKALKEADAHILEEVAKTALSLCRAHTAGISVEEEDHGRKVFRWRVAPGSRVVRLHGINPHEDSPSGMVLDRGTPQLMAHPERHFVKLSENSPPPVEALIVPFDVGGVTVGTVWVIANDETLHFDREDLRLLQSLSECASVICEMLQREAQVQDALARERDGSQLLQAISAGMIRENDVNAVYEQILDAAVSIMRADCAGMQMLDDGQLSLIAWRGFHPDSARFWQSVDVDSATPCGGMLRTGQRFAIADTEHDELLAGTADLDEFRRSGVRAVQSTPLTSRSGQLLGALSTGWHAPHEPTMDECQLFDVLSRLAADLIERAKTDQALREADHRKNEFLAVLGHELRNPLTPLLAGLEVLEGDTNVESIDEIHSMMRRQVSHLMGLVDDLLDLSRITQGKVNLHRTPLDLRVAIDAALEQTKPLIEERKQTLLVEQFERVLPMEGDGERLTQVIANILSNAAKYTDIGGRIHLSSRSERGHAVIRIRDSGIGVPAGQLETIFEMFTQVPEHRARSGGGGLGIGLAISRRLVELHGGSICARSKGLGCGSEFLIRLPLGTSVLRARSGLRHERGAAQRRQRILIIEDNVDVAKALRVLVTSIGHVAQTAQDGPSGIKLLETFTPDVLLLDIGLPGMSGYEVARRVRSMPIGARVLIVAVTGWGQDCDREHARQAGFDHHLTKPIRRDELERALSGVHRAAAADLAS